MLADPDFPRLREAAGLYPFSMTGQALSDYVKKAVDDYGRRASQLGLVR
jgi:putative tricarboxylic transport membrane protein